MYSEFSYHAIVLTHWFVLKYYWQEVRQSVRHHIHHLNVGR